MQCSCCRILAVECSLFKPALATVAMYNLTYCAAENFVKRCTARTSASQLIYFLRPHTQHGLLRIIAFSRITIQRFIKYRPTPEYQPSLLLARARHPYRRALVLKWGRAGCYLPVVKRSAGIHKRSTPLCRFGTCLGNANNESSRLDTNHGSGPCPIAWVYFPATEVYLNGASDDCCETRRAVPLHRRRRPRPTT
jgi:hypothetical protein